MWLFAAGITSCAHRGDDVRESFIATVSALPYGSIYEESTEQFTDRIKAGHYWTEQTAEGEVAYLLIGGGWLYLRTFVYSVSGGRALCADE